MRKVAVANAAQLFAHEVREARALGFRLTLNNQPASVACRLVPETPRARIIAARSAPEGTHEPVVESVATVADQADRLDVTAQVIRAVLELAKDSGA